MLKRKFDASKEPENLKKCRLDVKEFVANRAKSGSVLAVSGAEVSLNPSCRRRTQKSGTSTITHNGSRKELRKQCRKLKKMRIHAAKQKKPVPTLKTLAAEKAEKEKCEKQKLAKKLKQKQKRKAKLRKLHEAEEKKAVLLSDQKRDERLLRQIEKDLGVKKQKRERLMKSLLEEDGFDFVFDYVKGDPEEDVSGWHKKASTPEEEISEEDAGDDVEESGSDVNSDEDSNVSDELEDNDSDSDSGITEETVEDSSMHVNMKTEPKADEAKKKRLAALAELVQSQSTDAGVKVKSIMKSDLSESSEKQTKKVKFGETPLVSESAAEAKKKRLAALAALVQSHVAGDPPVSDLEPSSSGALREDIYGRLRDEQGRVVEQKKTDAADSTVGKWVPSRLKAGASDEATAQRRYLVSKINGLVNRLSEATTQSVCNGIESLYGEHSRADTNEALTSVLLSTVLRIEANPEICVNVALLLAVLHNRVGIEVTATFLQTLILRYREMFVRMPEALPDSDELFDYVKKINHAARLLAYLYIFKVLSSQLIGDLMAEMVQRFCERDMELLKLLLTEAGLVLRKEEPEKLAQVFDLIQQKSANVSVSTAHASCALSFLQETVTAVKHNNATALQAHNNERQLDFVHLKKLLRTYIAGSQNSALNVSLEDLLDADKRGKWYLVGAAWSGDTSRASTAPVDETEVQPKSAMNAKMDRLGRKLGINTASRRAIFATILTSEDCKDAFMRLLKLIDKQSMQQREAVYIILKLCIHERPYNAFYAYLLSMFCRYHRQYKLTVQAAIQDELKLLDDPQMKKRYLRKQHMLNNLADISANLIASSSVSVAVLQDVNFVELPELVNKLLKRVLHKLLSLPSEDSVRTVFGHIAGKHKYNLLRESLRLFLDLRFKCPTEEVSQDIDFVARRQMAIKAMLTGNNQ